MAENISNAALYAAIESVAKSVGPETLGRMHMTIAQKEYQEMRAAFVASQGQIARKQEGADSVKQMAITQNYVHNFGRSLKWNSEILKKQKDAELERVYPVTRMSLEDINSAAMQAVRGVSTYLDHTSKAYRGVANAALRHAIDAGQVVTREEFDRMCEDRKARDMAVAKAVRDAHFKREGNTMIFRTPSDDCLAAIIAEVQL